MILALKKFTKEQVGDVLQRLYNSEINFQISTFWDVGFNVAVGDNANGWKSEIAEPFTNAKLDWTSAADSISGLAYYASKHWPDSEFATWYKSLDQ